MNKKISTAICAVFLSGGAMAQPPVDIQVFFDGSSCPTGVSNPSPGVNRGRLIKWQAVDAAGNPARIGFQIYFDPIQGGPLRAPQGSIQRPVNNSVPAATYKYTIVGDACPQRPLDPNSRVS